MEDLHSNLDLPYFGFFYIKASYKITIVLFVNKNLKINIVFSSLCLFSTRMTSSKGICAALYGDVLVNCIYSYKIFGMTLYLYKIYVPIYVKLKAICGKHCTFLIQGSYVIFKTGHQTKIQKYVKKAGTSFMAFANCICMEQKFCLKSFAIKEDLLGVVIYN